MLTLKNIYKIYENGTVAVRNVSLEFPQVGMVAITGTSGCGKSTLLNLLSNNDIPSKGELLYNDKHYSEYSKETLIKDFAYIYQDFKLIDNLTVYQNIMIGHELANKDIDYDLVLGIAKELGIFEILDEKVYALSGGQQQRVAIARTLARKPKVIFADEPTGNLDSSNSKNVYEILSKISKEILVVIVSHDKEIAKYADRIIEISNGKIVVDKTAQELLEINTTDSQVKVEKELLDTDIYYKKKPVQKTQVKSKKQSKIGTKSVFSYTKGKNCTRKKEGLSSNNILGLIIAFNNKKTGKKIILSIICLVMIALILTTTAMIFSTPENTFVHNIHKRNEKFVKVNLISFLQDYRITQNDIDDLNNFMVEKYDTKMYELCASYLNSYVTIVPDEDVVVPSKYGDYLRDFLSHTLYTDNPAELGIQLIEGRTPTKENEIAISKTCYEYFTEVKYFHNYYGDNITFNSKNDILGDNSLFFEKFNIIITGVFEDKNKNEDKFIVLDDRQHNNINNSCLTTAIIRPEKLANIAESFYSSQYDPNITYAGNEYYNDIMSKYLPINKYVSDYYYREDIFKTKIEKNHIILTQEFVTKYKKYMNIDLQVGMSVKLIAAEYLAMQTKVQEVQPPKEFIIDAITDKTHGNILLNESDYNEWVIGSPIIKRFLINSKNITPSFMKKINNYFYNNFATGNESKQKDNFYVDFDMDYYLNMGIDDTNILKVCNSYVAIPLLFLSIFILTVLFSVLLSDTINDKMKDLLILRSLGADKKEIFKLFSILVVVFLVLLLAIGLLVGTLGINLLNYVWALLCGYDFLISTFWIGWESLLVLFFAMIAVCGTILFVSMLKINGKNLRKSFQKQKK